MNNNVINVKRLATAGDKEEYPEEFHLEGIGCYIEQTDPRVAAAFGDENAFKTFLCVICEILDIKISDKIIDQEGVEYRVGGILKLKNPEIDDHIEITMFEEYEN